MNRLQKAAGIGGNETQEWCKHATPAQLAEGLWAIAGFRIEHRIYIETEIAARRHREVESHLSELRKPHWTVVPTFWLVIIGIVVGISAGVISWLAWHRPVQPPAAVSSSASTQSGSASPSPLPASVVQTHSSTQLTVARATPLPLPSATPQPQGTTATPALVPSAAGTTSTPAPQAATPLPKTGP